MKCNFTGALRDGQVVGAATLLHGGCTTQLWRARTEDAATGKLMASFRRARVSFHPS